MVAMGEPRDRFVSAAAWLRPPGWPLLDEDERPRVRLFALLALGAQPLFVAGWVVAGAAQDGYSAREQTVSELAADGAAHPWIVTAAIAVLGLGYIALALALAPGLRGRPWGRVAPGLFAAAGVGTVLVALLPLECAPNASAVCRTRELEGDLSLTHYAHGWLSLLVVAALAGTPLALAKAEWPSRLGRLTLAGGLAGLVLWVVGFLLADPDAGDDGTGQRLGLLLIHAWVATVAVTLLVEASSWARSIAARADR
jgi:hypothetical protein